MTEAGALLRYQSAQVIKKLVSEGFLNRYHILDSKRIYVERNEVESRIQPADINDIPKKMYLSDRYS